MFEVSNLSSLFFSEKSFAAKISAWSNRWTNSFEDSIPLNIVLPKIKMGMKSAKLINYCTRTENLMLPRRKTISSEYCSLIFRPFNIKMHWTSLVTSITILRMPIYLCKLAFFLETAIIPIMAVTETNTNWNPIGNIVYNERYDMSYWCIKWLTVRMKNKFRTQSRVIRAFRRV